MSEEKDLEGDIFARKINSNNQNIFELVLMGLKGGKQGQKP